ncbi:MAG: ankyrin repeat domain-containing protein [Rickettsiales bacterium]|jgi:ankyrin repeat protein|nr:ankyrin repeat domain-containing protein [Rickettsiales bacterium]
MRFSGKDKKKFNKSLKELLENSFKNIYERDKKGRTILHYAVGISDQKTVGY